jgi:hypothetical protein
LERKHKLALEFLVQLMMIAIVQQEKHVRKVFVLVMGAEEEAGEAMKNVTI